MHTQTMNGGDGGKEGVTGASHPAQIKRQQGPGLGKTPCQSNVVEGDRTTNIFLWPLHIHA